MERLLLEAERPVNLNEVRNLRHLIAQTIQAEVSCPSINQQILLCLSEAATNLAQHATPEATRMIVRFYHNHSGWWLKLLDNGSSWNPVEHSPANTLTNFNDHEQGRGVALLHSQCSRLEYKSGNSESFNQLILFWKRPKLTSRPTILIVEDDNALRRLYQAYLTESFNVKTAADGPEALKQLKHNTIDLILSDIRMPQMTGLTLREHLSQHRNTNLIPFIFLTGADNTNIQHQAMSLGIDDYLVKPVDKNKLIHTIFRILGRSQQIYRQLTNRINQRISSALTPKLPKQSHGWRIQVGSRNTGIGGGDLLLHQNNQQGLLIVLADIMGHDDSAKFFSYAYGGYLRGLMHTTNDLSPADLLERLSTIALQDELFSQITLTSCVATLCPEGNLSLATAGHPPPLRLSDNGAEPINSSGILPGLLADTHYENTSLTISTGERVAFYTDGLFESADNENLRQQLEDQIINILLKTRHLPINQSLSQTMAVFDQLAGPTPKDDALLLLAEPAY